MTDKIVISPTRENILMIDYIYDRVAKIPEVDALTTLNH